MACHPGHTHLGRGLGPAWQSAAFDMFAVSRLGPQALPAASPVSPTGPMNMLVSGSMFLLREIAACWAHITFGTNEVQWLLPASKTDTAALGIMFTWGFT